MAPKLAASLPLARSVGIRELTLMGLLIARGADDADAVAVASREQDVESRVSYGCVVVEKRIPD